MSNFITNNEQKNLKNRLIELIKRSEELKFLVGFFYFSGIRELYKGLKENPNVNIKVLVGLLVNKTNFGLLEIANERESQSSTFERQYKFLESVKKSLNSENFDTQEFYEQVKFFIKLIQEDKLIIRKTNHPNHAKIYIFKLQEEQVGRRNLFITGSSNLTKAGLTTQQEFNVEISDFGVEDAEKYFDDLWEDAVKVTEDNVVKQKLIDAVEKDTLVKDISPFEAYLLILKIYLDSYEQKEIGESLIRIFVENGYKPYQYQLDAVKQALAIIEKNNGVILADVVGLGKTVIACAIARELKERGIVICPPGLIGDRDKTYGWNKYLEEFQLPEWEVRSLGELENIAEFVKRFKDIKVVIIDEAHRFRNQDTQDYEYLKNICRDKIVILLTATPFNNRPGDILSLLKLFITPKKSSISLENNIVDKFKAFKGVFDRLGFIVKYWNSPNASKRQKAENYYQGFFGELPVDLQKVKQRSQYLSKQIRDVIEPVTIRRNRLDLQNNPFYKDDINDLSKIKDPDEWFFELTTEQSDFYDRIIIEYFGDPDDGGQFKGAIYRPFEYEIERERIDGEKLTEKENFQYFQQRNLYDFMRRMLVKRFESSFGSFRQSIMNFQKITQAAKDFIKNSRGKYILDRDLLEKIYKLEYEQIEEYLEDYSENIKKGEYPKNHKVYEVDKFIYKEQFIADIESDLELFKNILEELDKLDLVHNDPKTACLISNLDKIIMQPPKHEEQKRKVVIFSEYLDTVKYLEPLLEKQFKNRLLVISGDFTRTKINALNQNFDAMYKEQEDKYDILLASDRISEGFNLNRAGLVINYDIPWNPVRVIQRVGRINRISKKVFDELQITNFFPTEKGSTLVRSREIASTKMFLIHNTLGEDAKIFDIDEEPTPAGLYQRIQANPDIYEQENFYTKMLKQFYEIKRQNPELIERLKDYPNRIKVTKRYKDNELIVFIKKIRMYVYKMNYDDENKNNIYQTTLEEIIENIACNKDEKKLPLSDLFWDSYEKVKNFKEYRIAPLSEQSLEQRSLNNLNYLVRNPWEELVPYSEFLRTLREDIIDYGTLSDYTLRRITNFEYTDANKKEQTVDEVKKLQNELGEDYLEKEKARQKDLHKDIIIAVENQKI
jgi:ERCC4-related helicase/HKD family nuclease